MKYLYTIILTTAKHLNFRSHSPSHSPGDSATMEDLFYEAAAMALGLVECLLIFGTYIAKLSVGTATGAIISAIVVDIGIPILAMICVSFSIFMVSKKLAEKTIKAVSITSFACLILPITFAAHGFLNTGLLFVLDGAMVLTLCYKVLFDKMNTIRHDQSEKKAEEARKQERYIRIMERSPSAVLQTKIQLRKRRERKAEEDQQRAVRDKEIRQLRKFREDVKMAAREEEARKARDKILAVCRNLDRRMQLHQVNIGVESQTKEPPFAKIQSIHDGQDDPQSREEIFMSIQQNFDSFSTLRDKGKQFSTLSDLLDKYIMSTREQAKETPELQAEAPGVNVRIDKGTQTMEIHLSTTGKKRRRETLTDSAIADTGSAIGDIAQIGWMLPQFEDMDESEKEIWTEAAIAEMAQTGWMQPYCESMIESEKESHQRHAMDYLEV